MNAAAKKHRSKSSRLDVGPGAVSLSAPRAVSARVHYRTPLCFSERSGVDPAPLRDPEAHLPQAVARQAAG